MTDINLIFHPDTKDAAMRDTSAKIIEIFAANQAVSQKQSRHDRMRRMHFTTPLDVNEIRERTPRLDEIPVGVAYTIVF